MVCGCVAVIKLIILIHYFTWDALFSVTVPNCWLNKSRVLPRDQGS